MFITLWLPIYLLQVGFLKNINKMSNDGYYEKQLNLKDIIKQYCYEKTKQIVEPQSISLYSLFSLTNQVYRVNANGQSLLLKVYQPTLQQFTDNQLQSIIVTKLAEENLHPPVLLCTPKYRIEQFVESLEITQRTLGKEKLTVIITKLAYFSCKYAQMVKTYNLTKGTTNKFELTNLLKIFEAIYKAKKFECPHLVQECQADLLSVFHNGPVIKKLLDILNKTPTMLCHNDCHLGNILSSPKGQYIVDFQFCQFNYLGYDLGNFLNQWATEYSTIFEIRDEMKEDLMHQIIKIYFSQLKDTYECGSTFQKWFYYTKIGRVLSHFFWMIIGLKQINDARIEFSMIYYIKRRKQEFFKRFEELLKMNNDF